MRSGRSLFVCSCLTYFFLELCFPQVFNREVGMIEQYDAWLCGYVNVLLMFSTFRMSYRQLRIKCFNCLSKFYLKGIFDTNSSSISKQLIDPNTNLDLDKHAFSVAAPTIWNEAPAL